MKQSSINKARSLMLAWLLVLAFISSPFADAFRSSATATPPDVVPLDLPAKQMRILPKTQPEEFRKADIGNTKHGDGQSSTVRRKVTYDLGLGKNKPVINKRADETKATDVSPDPAQFMIQHDAVNKIPSPLDSTSKSNNQSKAARKKLPKVNHRRHSEDVLHIRDFPTFRNDQNDHRNDEKTQHPIIGRRTTSTGATVAKLDVNTVWVEMMLHNERNKMLAQSS